MKRLLLLVVLALTLLLVRPALAQAPYINAVKPTACNVSGSIYTWLIAADVYSGATGTTPNGYGSVTYYLRYTTYSGPRYSYDERVTYNGWQSWAGSNYLFDTQAFTQIGPVVVDPVGIPANTAYTRTSPKLDGAFNANGSAFFRSHHENLDDGPHHIEYTLRGGQWSYSVKVELFHYSGGNVVVDAASVNNESGWAHELGSISP